MEAAWSGPLVVRDAALGAHVGASVVGVVPVGLQADGTEVMATGDGHGVPQIFLTQVTNILVGRHLSIYLSMFVIAVSLRR